MYESPTKSIYSSSLSPAYFTDMSEVLRRYGGDWLPKKDEQYIRYFYDVYTYGRMDQMVDCVLPWVKAAIPQFETRDVLEIGCGTGSSSAGLIQACRSVFGFDIDSDAVSVARARCDLIKQHSEAKVLAV